MSVSTSKDPSMSLSRENAIMKASAPTHIDNIKWDHDDPFNPEKNTFPFIAYAYRKSSNGAMHRLFFCKTEEERQQFEKPDTFLTPPHRIVTNPLSHTGGKNMTGFGKAPHKAFGQTPEIMQHSFATSVRGWALFEDDIDNDDTVSVNRPEKRDRHFLRTLAFFEHMRYTFALYQARFKVGPAYDNAKNFIRNVYEEKGIAAIPTEAEIVKRLLVKVSSPMAPRRTQEGSEVIEDPEDVTIYLEHPAFQKIYESDNKKGKKKSPHQTIQSKAPAKSDVVAQLEACAASYDHAVKLPIVRAVTRRNNGVTTVAVPHHRIADVMKAGDAATFTVKMLAKLYGGTEEENHWTSVIQLHSTFLNRRCPSHRTPPSFNVENIQMTKESMNAVETFNIDDPEPQAPVPAITGGEANPLKRSYTNVGLIAPAEQSTVAPAKRPDTGVGMSPEEMAEFF